MRIEFTVPAVPVAQPRQRHRIIPGRNFVQNYTPANSPVNAFKAAVMAAAGAVYDGPPIEGPIDLRVTFVMPRPKSMVWKSRPMPREMHIKKPDGDNLVKALKDALTGRGIWRDDCQVCDCRVIKVTASGQEQPHAEVQISELGVG